MPENVVATPALTPPVARREPTPTTLHGKTLEDNYRWMRDKGSPEVIAYLEAENAYASAVMKPTEELQAKLYAEMLSHIKETDESVPFRERAWYYSPVQLRGINIRSTVGARPSMASTMLRSPSK